METSLVISLGIAFVAIIIIAKTAVIVPQQSAFVVENLGKYSRTLKAGFHILIPFVERTAYRHTLKELAADIAEQGAGMHHQGQCTGGCRWGVIYSGTQRRARFIRY